MRVVNKGITGGLYPLLLAVVSVFTLLMAVPADAGEWRRIDSGVGLIIEDENYDRRLQVVERGNVWNAKALYENGAQAGKYRGNQLFAAWLQGPPASEYLNRNGIPAWMYKYRITYPDGKTFEAGPSGFYSAGFTYFGIKTGGYTTGSWKIDWYIVHRDTKETRLVSTDVFTTTYGK